MGARWVPQASGSRSHRLGARPSGLAEDVHGSHPEVPVGGAADVAGRVRGDRADCGAGDTGGERGVQAALDDVARRARDSRPGDGRPLVANRRGPQPRSGSRVPPGAATGTVRGCSTPRCRRRCPPPRGRRRCCSGRRWCRRRSPHRFRCWGPTVASWVKVAPLSVDRWTMNRASVVAVSCQVRFTRGAAAVPASVAASPVGAVGALTPRTAVVDDTVMDGMPEP